MVSLSLPDGVKVNMLGKRLPFLAGVLCISAAALTLEITLSRIFSVTMWYHFAFLVISLALLGSGAAGVWIYVFPRLFPREKTAERLVLLASLFAVAVVVTYVLYWQIPFNVSRLREQMTWDHVFALALIYLILTIPFLFAGACLALAISRYAEVASRVYFADLSGASVGCLVSVLALNALGGSGAVLAVAALGGLAALSFALQVPGRVWRAAGGAVTAIALVLLVGNQAAGWLYFAPQETYRPDLSLRPLYERWNSFSRVTIYEDPYWLQPFGWGLSPNYTGPDPGHLMLLIDEKAGTPIQFYDGNPQTADFLRYDITAIPYLLHAPDNVFIIGPGGGRDVLTAHLFGTPRIVGVEINGAIVDAVTGPYAGYAGHIYAQPGVEIAIDDARTYLTRLGEHFDLIQASLVDTWAASAGGAFALSENGIYTKEAFRAYYDHLTPEGVVNFSRWYFPQLPAETLRLVTLALEAWRDAGVADPAQHVVVIGNLAATRAATEGLATLLLKKDPFTSEEVEQIVSHSEALGFAVLYAPGYQAEDNLVQQMVNTPDLRAFIASYPLDISPVTDDRPFFFSLVRLGDLIRPEFTGSGVYQLSAEAVQILLAAAVISTALAILFLFGPLILRRQREERATGQARYLVYFAALGLGFMLIELPMVQRLNLYLGHPTYALVVVLFSILLFSGLGSLSTGSVAQTAAPAQIRRTLPLLIALMLAYTFVTPTITSATQAWALPARIAVVVALLAPAGLLMGRPFPLGLKWANAETPGLLPWLWAVNGTLSVSGSVLAVLLAIHLGFSAVMLVGAVGYGVALAASGWPARRTRVKARESTVSV